MALKLNYDFLFVGKDDNSFLENYSYDMYDKFGEKSGEIFINLEIQNNPANSEEIGEAVFGIFQEEFFADVEAEPYARFERALKAVNIGLEEFKKQKVSGYIGNLNVVIAAFVNGVLYLSQTGDGEAYLARKRFLSVVTEGLSEENSGEIFSNIASGGLEEGDTVLISSTRLLRYVSKNDLARLLFGIEPAEILAEIKESIATEMLGKVGLTTICARKAPEMELAGGQMSEDRDALQGALVETASSARSISTPSGGSINIKSTATKVLFGAGGAAKKAFGFVSDKIRQRRAMKRVSSPRDFRGSISGMGSRIGGLKKGLIARGFSGKKPLIAVIGVIILLIAGVWIVQAQRAKQQELAAIDNMLINVQNQISEAETKGQYDKESAGQILAKAQTDAMSALNTDFRDKANILLQQIDEARNSLDNVKLVKEPSLVADLTTKNPTVNALGFALMVGRTFVYESNALYELVLDQIQAPVALDDTEVVISGTSFADRNSLVFLTKSGKLIEYKDGAISFVDTSEGTFHKGVALSTWGNRVYILDPESNQLWRYTYQANQKRFGVGEAYTQAGNFALSKDFAIDGNIWVLTDKGFDKYYAGAKQDLIVSKSPFSAFKTPIKIVTDGEMKQIFVLDSTENRILVFYKDDSTGNLIYDNQYKVQGIGEIRDMTVDLNAKRIKVLTPTAVYQFDM